MRARGKHRLLAEQKYNINNHIAHLPVCDAWAAHRAGANCESECRGANAQGDTPEDEHRNEDQHAPHHAQHLAGPTARRQGLVGELAT